MKFYKILLPILAAALLAAPFLEPWWFPLAWIAFVPLFYVIERADTLRRAVFYGWLMGLAAHLIGFHWLTYTISVFGGFPFAVSIVVFVLYAALQGIQMALFALLVRSIGFGPLMIFPAVFWVVCEFLFPLLFPWYIANSQVSFLWVIQTADLVGPYGTGFIVIWFSAALYHALFANVEPRRKIVPLAYACLAIVVALVYGFQRLQSVGDDMAGAGKLSVGAVQGNVDIDMKWNPVLAQKNLAHHRQLTDQLDAVPLVIWPESAIEALIPEAMAALPLDVMPTFKAERAYFIFGAKSFRGTPGKTDFKAFNTAFFADAKGRILARYHKQVLLAFGEYLPFARLLAWIPAMPFADGFTPGPGPAVFHLPRSVRAAPLICYEDLMPELARRFVTETRANVLINLTNDAWYGKSVGPWQHLRLAQSRAIETRRSLLRVTNTGVTSLVNAKGELVKLLPMFTSAVMQTEVDVLNETTYYVQFGDWFAWLMTIAAGALILFHVKRSWLRK
ncbi:MAG TPA: apolipoprotein N-acyltransferase [Candidatus Limnocylindrales bacterium]|nr:apolipoprotein N-acyltransferase [Candidatus Limnocylindrales bacterium]